MHPIFRQLNEQHCIAALNKFSASYESIKESVVWQDNYGLLDMEFLFKQNFELLGNLLKLLLVSFYDWVWVYLDIGVTASSMH